MKLNYKSILTIVALMATGASANAGMITDWYAGAMAGIGGATLVSKDHRFSHSAQVYGGVIGVDLPVVRFEAEYNYTNSDPINMNLVMGNAYVKLPAFIGTNPYIGVGVGLMFDAKTDYYDKKIDANIAYQGMLGTTLEIPVLPFKIDVEGRAMMVPEIYSVGDQKYNVIQYDGRVKLRYIF